MDITEGTNDLNKVIIQEQVIAAPKVEDEQPVSIAMVEQKPEFPGAKLPCTSGSATTSIIPGSI